MAASLVPYDNRYYIYDSAGRLQMVSNDILIYPAQGNLAATEIASANLFSATSYGAFGLKSATLAADTTWHIPAMTLTRTYENRERTATEVDQNSTLLSASDQASAGARQYAES